MPGETNLDILIKSMKPELNEGQYIFATFNPGYSFQIPIEDILMVFREKEGMTLIMSVELALKHNLKAEILFSWITLSIHSSLTAVGLTAAFSAALAEKNISCNVVAGYYHDHIFVDYKDAEDAMTALLQLSTID